MGAGDACGVDRKTVKVAVAAVYTRAARQGYAPDYDLTKVIPDGMTSRGTSILYDVKGKIKEYWNKTKASGRPPEESVQLPDPKVVTKVSTLYDHEGNVTQQWVAERPEERARIELWKEAALEFASGIPPAPALPEPEQTEPNLMACYPIGDHHMGMLSWNQETGKDWDIKIAEDTLARAVDYLVAATPPSRKAAVVFLGDFMHYDSFETVTPTSRNLLDADGRFPKMVRAAIRSMRRTIDAAAVRHGQVNVIVEIGNHDLSSSIFLMECLSNLYANDPRISVDTSPMHYHYFEHGKVLVGTHHGHGTKKPERLGPIMAADRPEAWGRTRYRYWWTGHIHHTKMFDLPGCSVESFRILAPADAWSHQKGYRAARDMKAIVLHEEFGEVARHTVNPEMFK